MTKREIVEALKELRAEAMLLTYGDEKEQAAKAAEHIRNAITELEGDGAGAGENLAKPYIIGAYVFSKGDGGELVAAYNRRFASRDAAFAVMRAATADIMPRYDQEAGEVAGYVERYSVLMKVCADDGKAELYADEVSIVNVEHADRVFRAGGFMGGIINDVLNS